MLDAALLNQITVTLLWANRHDWHPGTQGRSQHSKYGGLWFVEKGQIEAQLSGTRFSLHAGQALLLPRNTLREKIVSDKGALWWSIGFDAELFGRVDILPLLRPPLVWEPDSPTRCLLQTWISQAVDQWPVDAPDKALPLSQPRDLQASLIGDGIAKAVFGLCWRVLAQRTRVDSSPLRISGAPEWLVPALWAIQEQPKLTPSEICTRFDVSPAHLRRTFHRFVGMSPQNHITERRLERACQLLQGTHMTVAAVGESIGFDSVHTFSRIFSERFHMPPSRWRERHMHGEAVQTEGNYS